MAILTIEDVIEDPCTDEAGQIMKAMLAIPTQTKVKRGLFNELDASLVNAKYIYFTVLDFPDYLQFFVVNPVSLFQVS